MDLSNVDLLSLQPSFLKNDPTAKALCAALQPKFQEVANEVKFCLIFSRVDELDHAALDELAWQMHVDWYDSAADIETKRKIIKSAPEVHGYRGTTYAAEEVIQAYFGDGVIEEWFEYGGQPGMFNVITNNASVTDELAEQFIKVLNTVKRKSSHLDQILITLADNMNLYFAGVVHTGDYLKLRQVT